MDGHKLIIKKEENIFENEDKNDNYLQLDFEVGVKVENNLPDIDWSLENAEEYQSSIVYEEVKDEFGVYTCPICLWMFSDRYALYQHNLIHLKVTLNKPKLYQCNFCQHYFQSKLHIKKHIHTKHFLMFMNHKVPGSHSLQQCTLCHKTLSYKSWHGHMTDVHGSTSYECNECHAVFKSKRYLRRHILCIHTENKPLRFLKGPVEGLDRFQCDLCPRVFTNRNSYRTHLRNCHSQSYDCKLCNSKLKSRTYLFAHMRRVHYDDGKVYKCDICSKEFRSPRYLNIHRKNSHLVKVTAVKNKKSRGKTKYIIEN